MPADLIMAGYWLTVLYLGTIGAGLGYLRYLREGAPNG